MIEILLAAVETDEDREKVLHIYNNYYRLMSYIINIFVDNPEDVADLTQDCMLRIIDNLDIIDVSDKSRAKGLFATIARNAAAVFLKQKQNKEIEYNDEIYNSFASEENIEDYVISNDTYQKILNAINTLPDVYKDVCRLKYVFNYREKEIALLLDLSQATVNQRIFRGKQELRYLIRKENLL